LIDTGLNQIGVIGKDSEATRVYDTTCARTIKDSGGMGAKTGLYKVQSCAMRNKNRSKHQGSNGGEYGDYEKEYQLESRKDDVSYTVKQTTHEFMVNDKKSIRRLTPVECERLQGFPDGWTEGQSDTQRYKQMGNAVSVPVVKSIMEKLYK